MTGDKPWDGLDVQQCLKLLQLFRDVPPHRQTSFLRMVKWIVDGVALEEAETLYSIEIAKADAKHALH